MMIMQATIFNVIEEIKAEKADRDPNDRKKIQLLMKTMN